MGIVWGLFRALIVNFVILAMFFVSIFGGAAPVHSQIAIIPPQKGMCYVTWDRNRFRSEFSDASLRKLHSLGVEYISIVATQYQEKYNSTEIKKTDKTPTDLSLRHVMGRAHKTGLKVMFKPHIDLIDKYDGTYWRADIGFATEKDWQTWFKAYRKMIVSYAKLAQQYKVEIFCVGTELSFTTQRSDEWRKIIEAVRKVYKGKITYAANWDNFKNIDFWEELDFVGIDAYFPLTYKADPSLEDLKQGWEKWIQEIDVWKPTVNKPIIFTEIGYASTSHAPHTPWKGGSYGEADPKTQALCYEAFFQTVWKREWLAGAYWWKWDTNTRAGGVYNRQFTPQNKPAQKIIEAHYKGIQKDAEVAAMLAGNQQKETTDTEQKASAAKESVVPEKIAAPQEEPVTLQEETVNLQKELEALKKEIEEPTTKVSEPPKTVKTVEAATPQEATKTQEIETPVKPVAAEKTVTLQENAKPQGTILQKVLMFARLALIRFGKWYVNKLEQVA